MDGKEKEPPSTGGPKITDDTPTVAGRCGRRKQSQLVLFVWLSRRYRHWWSRPDHAFMLWRMFGRIVAEEARDA
jgi:hypothetical protein